MTELETDVRVLNRVTITYTHVLHQCFNMKYVSNDINVFVDRHLQRRPLIVLILCP